MSVICLEQGLQFRPVPPGTGGIYRSARLSVRRPPVTGRFRQKSTAGGRLKKKSTVRSIEEEKGKKKRKRKEKEERKKEYLARGRQAFFF
ncbi:hypothetical protein B296_00049282 [Ensete ventricosum]|uniref:Uncharacterized protein n=1 Tax=Ensete ventricosum TaxID=4639 RepID=A0A426YRC1_ENSVE|nr:hypothetical protein B296_00049282 [Ensete ventricosum]